MNLSIQGSSSKVILFIHGFCETLNIWKPYVEALKENYKVISIDLPGHGKTSLVTSQFTIEDIADLVIEEMNSLAVGKFFVIGHSLGGYISLALSELYPDAVTGFGLFSSTTFPDDDEKRKVRDKVGGFIAEHGHKEFIDSFVPNLFTPENRRTFVEEIETLKKNAYLTSTESIVGYSQAMKVRPDRTKQLSIDKPKFIIAGDRDMAVKIESSKEMMTFIPESDSLILKDTGHNGFLEAQVDSITYIKEFLLRNSINL
ncbi:alpha/beta fold hydrolase [Reichenbachiella versicolor]|uniref:alpha/beta fold hydrolase n=1 Tax=Reichenbachiella versicolor TaxID=1821036 RepID=UPI000D6E14F5|nr:alpha/beta hydrolase [Reichenbachiella versicolor]